MARKKKNIRLRTSFAVLGDGRTEQAYLKHLKAIRDYRYSVYPSLFDNITHDTAEKKIDELLSGGCDLIVYITDYDTVVSQVKQKTFNDLVKKYEKNDEVLICESMPSIEFWFLLHYQLTTREFKNADEAAELLKKYIPDFSKSKDFLENRKWVEDLSGNGQLEKAITNARNVLRQKETDDVGRHFPFTRVHEGIEKFENEKKERLARVD
ncbi:RloB family protein [uncultured Draconibacterium sp.]|uniref:RloB family protein n=1 Tax=uncultured Draconibacterium sp. TaxID=1573823 RepID=UPI0029C059AD|nr:RloB family protein [uncultured Draconibacterium sp.]